MSNLRTSPLLIYRISNSALGFLAGRDQMISWTLYGTQTGWRLGHPWAKVLKYLAPNYYGLNCVPLPLNRFASQPSLFLNIT